MIYSIFLNGEVLEARGTENLLESVGALGFEQDLRGLYGLVESA